MQFRPKRLRFPLPGWNFHTLVPLTLLLIYLPFHFTGGPSGPLFGWYQLLGLSRESFFQQGHIWGLFTHPLLHGNLSHWLTNAYLIYYFGGRIHDIFGEREVWRVAAWATLGGGVLHLLFQGSLPLVGALRSSYRTLDRPDERCRRTRKMFPLPVRASNLRNGIILGTVILLLMIPSLGNPCLRGPRRKNFRARRGESFPDWTCLPSRWSNCGSLGNAQVFPQAHHLGTASARASGPRRGQQRSRLSVLGYPAGNSSLKQNPCFSGFQVSTSTWLSFHRARGDFPENPTDDWRPRSRPEG